MSKMDEITREKWILGAFPEWGTWLNEEIDGEVVQPGTFAMWWIGCTGLWVKSENHTNIAVDLWFGNGKRTQRVKEMAPYHQMRNMTGGRMTQPNLRAAPVVYDPFAVSAVDAVLRSGGAVYRAGKERGKMDGIRGAERQVPDGQARRHSPDQGLRDPCRGFL